MFARLVYQSFFRQRRRKLLAGVAIVLGVGVATAMIAVATDIGDKMNRELRTYGANIIVYPQDDTLDVKIGGVDLKPASDGAYLNEADLPKIKRIFWGHNIVGFAPVLPVEAELSSPAGWRGEAQALGTYFGKPIAVGANTYIEGVKLTHPWWKISGALPQDDQLQALVGEALAQRAGIKTGDRIQIAGHSVAVSGIVSADEVTNSNIMVPLSLAQQIAGKPGAVRQIYVSALTKPEDDFARRDPRSMSPEMRDRWYCSPYANSIAYQLEEAIPNGKAEQIRQVAQNEGKVLSKISGLMLLLALAALVASALAVSAAMATSVFERRSEIGLMKAIGAGKPAIAALFVTEAGVLACIGGLVGFILGALMARAIGQAVFGSQIAVQPVTFPIVLGLALAVTLGGSAVSIRRAVQQDAAIVLRGDA